MMFGGLEATQTASYEADKIFYSGRKIPCYVWLFTVMSLDGSMNVTGRQTKDRRKFSREFIQGGDTVKYLLSLTENYGYYDGIIPRNPFFP